VNLAPPPRGSIIRYAYLWAAESGWGKEEARKERPALVLTLAVREADGAIHVLALAITHTPPPDPAAAVELPQRVKDRLGLDASASWIVTTEANAFVWPGPDIRPVPGRKPQTVIYGQIPSELLQKVARSFLANRQRQRTRLIQRTR
jgi:hypothetical protein